MPSPSFAFTQSPHTAHPQRSRTRHPPRGSGWAGFTLLELITVLTLLGLALGRALPAGKHLLDRMAVVSARETAVGLFHRVRMEAVTRGGARLQLQSSPPSMRVMGSASVQIIEETHFDFGVTLTLSRNRPQVDLNFDAMGLGRVASQTVVFQRGEARAALVVSSLGRVTRK